MGRAGPPGDMRGGVDSPYRGAICRLSIVNGGVEKKNTPLGRKEEEGISCEKRQERKTANTGRGRAISSLFLRGRTGNTELR